MGRGKIGFLGLCLLGEWPGRNCQVSLTYWRKPCWGLVMWSGRYKVTLVLCLIHGKVGEVGFCGSVDGVVRYLGWISNSWLVFRRRTT